MTRDAEIERLEARINEVVKAVTKLTAVMEKLVRAMEAEKGYIYDPRTYH